MSRTDIHMESLKLLAQHEGETMTEYLREAIFPAAPTASHLMSLGEGWPPKPGWRERIIGRTIRSAAEADKVRKFQKLRRKFAAAMSHGISWSLPMQPHERDRLVAGLWELADAMAKGEPK